MNDDEDNEVHEEDTKDLIGEEKEVGSDQNENKIDQDMNDTDNEERERNAYLTNNSGFIEADPYNMDDSFMLSSSNPAN